AWVKKFLDPTRMKLLLSAKAMKASTQSSQVRKNIRYQNSFKETLLDYLKNAPSYAQNVFNVLIPYMDKMEIRMQEKIWENLFQKWDGNPQTQQDVVTHISRFLEHSNSDTAKKTFYSCFVKNVPQDLRAEILGQFSPKILTKYWNNFRHLEKSFIHSKVKTKLGNEYLLWYMFRQGKISNDELFAKLKKLNLEKYRPVIFAEKKDMDTSLFIRMGSYLAPSKNYFWRWVISFRNSPDFEHKLATVYPLFPKEIKDNQLYVVAMNNHFDLIRQCAYTGDTASLTNLKKILGKDSFWHSLTKGNNSGFRSLCQQEKRWILKSLSDLPLEQQKDLFTTPNDEGKTVLDVCPENFRRMIEENIFNNVRVKPNPDITSEEKREPKKQEDAEVLSPSNFVDENTEKAPFPRHIIRLQSFKDDLERFNTNPELQKDVEEAIETLSTMSKKRMQLELRESFKNHRKLVKTPCFVRNIRGNNYRLGYRVQGDVDKNEGKIAFLFFWTHEEYNNKLWNCTEFLVKQALLLMKQTPNVPPVPPTPPIPVNTGNSGR
ncbi:MAG: type II toxin-antitoxin system HigB family toxin, partial [Alphaproteobacteria bacterium]|nr:type II toxin-antitoxin system HigB family toxin [Alphaproteobacteria bacterium]